LQKDKTRLSRRALFYLELINKVVGRFWILGKDIILLYTLNNKQKLKTYEKIKF